MLLLLAGKRSYDTTAPAPSTEPLIGPDELNVHHMPSLSDINKLLHLWLDFFHRICKSDLQALSMEPLALIIMIKIENLTSVFLITGGEEKNV